MSEPLSWLIRTNHPAPAQSTSLLLSGKSWEWEIQPAGNPQTQPRSAGSGYSTRGLSVPQHWQRRDPGPAAEQAWMPRTHDDGAVSRATVQLVPAMTPGHKAGSPRDSAACRVPARPQAPGGTGAAAPQPCWAKAAHTHPRAGPAPMGGQAGLALGAGSQAPCW